jgi:hypothetical protein
MARGRHRHTTDYPNTIDGDADFWGLNHTQRTHYTDRVFSHRFHHIPHPGEDRATLYFIAGWISSTIAITAIIFWLLA